MKDKELREDVNQCIAAFDIAKYVETQIIKSLEEAENVK